METRIKVIRDDIMSGGKIKKDRSRITTII
jgi:hypothetical protein